ncbi:MAG: hypothetical protein HY690_06165, partial [Chloroflexi bacterium]|nr:hypothetical protein [Chloroflexota bacterium]
MPESLWAHQAAEDVSQQPDAAAGAMRDLLRSLRHDLRTPINHIVGYSELLLENAQDLGQPGLVASIQKILIAGTALLGHIGDFLDSSKANGGALDLDPLRFALRTQLNAIIGYSEMLYEETEEQGQPELAADFRRICSAGKHLLGVINAFLELSKAEAGEDAGEAAAPAGPPAGQEVLRLQPPAPPPAAEASVEPASVLVVDDNEINRDMLARRLDRLGYRVALAEHGRA